MQGFHAKNVVASFWIGIWNLLVWIIDIRGWVGKTGAISDTSKLLLGSNYLVLIGIWLVLN